VEAATGINRGLLSWWERGRYNLTAEETEKVNQAIDRLRKI